MNCASKLLAALHDRAIYRFVCDCSPDIVALHLSSTSVSPSRDHPSRDDDQQGRLLNVWTPV